MATILSPRNLHVSLLEDADRGALDAFLNRDRVATLYLRSLIQEFGVTPSPRMEHGSFFAARRDGELTALLFLGNSRNFTTHGATGDLIPVVSRALTRPEGPRLYVGPEAHAEICRGVFARHHGVPYVDRDQPYYVLEPARLETSEPLEIRPARLEDLDEVTRAQASMTEEDLGIPRTHLDLSRLEQISRARIEAGRVWVVMDGPHLVFKTEEASRSRDGVLVGGVYTDPVHRGRGVATRALAAWARILFDHGLEHLALHVNADNAPAVRAYERVGFRRHSMLRLILVY